MRTSRVHSGKSLLSACAIIGIALALGIPSVHIRSELGKQRPFPKLRPASPPRGYVPPTVAYLRLQPTSSNAEYWVKATENDYALHTCPTRLTISVGLPDHRRRIFDYSSCDWLQYVLPGGDGSALITVWETGSAVMTMVFRLSSDHVSLQMERATHLPPEFTLDGILLNTGWVPVHGRCCTADKTEIWTWTGQKYRLAATVPFSQRYDALQKLPPSAWK